MQDKNVTHEINLGLFLSWCFWSWAPSSQSDPAVANTDSVLPPKGFTKDGFCESGLEPFLFLGQILSLWDQTQGRFHFCPAWRSSDGSEKRQTQLELHAASAEKGKWVWALRAGLSCDAFVMWIDEEQHYFVLCISNCVWTLRSCRETGINPNVLNFISGNGQIRFKWLFKVELEREAGRCEISGLDTQCLCFSL